MTPKEKAQELFDKMFLVIENKGMYDDLFKAKQCALIAVDEIINTLSIEPIRVNNKYQTLNYWQEVKQEIEKL